MFRQLVDTYCLTTVKRYDWLFTGGGSEFVTRAIRGDIAWCAHTSAPVYDGHTARRRHYSVDLVRGSALHHPLTSVRCTSAM